MAIPKTAIVLLPVFWTNLPPLSLAYLKGFLKGHHVQVDCIDANHLFFTIASEDIQNTWRKSCDRDFERGITEVLRSRYPEAFHPFVDKLLDYDIVGFSCYRSNFSTTKEIAALLKQKKPGILIVLGGPEITRYFFKMDKQIEKVFKPFADFIVAGEGEAPLLDYLTDSHHTNSTLALFQEQQDLKDSPGPDFSDFDLASYPKRSAIPLIVSRGCIKRCRFCAERFLYKQFRLYPWPSIILQIADFKSKGISAFIFNDSLINADLLWLDAFCDALIKNFGSVAWEAQMAIRPAMSMGLLNKIKKSGCYHLCIGLESGSARTLKHMNKGYTPEEALDFFKRLKNAGLSFGVSMIVGFPHETEGDFLESLHFILKNREWIPKIEQINPFVYYDGIPFPESEDYKSRPESIDRAVYFIKRIKEEGIKHTNAFLLNLVETEWKSGKSI
jgi:radical SAM superfamily enzyme YgiQ (UPF0313 family)